MNRQLKLLNLLITVIFVSSCTNSYVKPDKNKIDKTFFIVASKVNLRSKPSNSSSKIKQLELFEAGEELERSSISETINGLNGSWVKVKINNSEGWVFSPFIRNHAPYSKSCHNSWKYSKFSGKIGYPSEELAINGLYIQNYKTKKTTSISFINKGKFETIGNFQITMPPGKYIFYADASAYSHKIYYTYCSGYDHSDYKTDPNCNRVIVIDAKPGCEYSNIKSFDYYSTVEANLP
ncbi:SH3 domain-containing protein [Leptospira sp. 'Mane']|uniref:SH3 domain-containing protein n=1 Tax=Leptospira sp. 'Mane' TaxID=3387407 RepID=UPI00398B8C02